VLNKPERCTASASQESALEMLESSESGVDRVDRDDRVYVLAPPARSRDSGSAARLRAGEVAVAFEDPDPACGGALDAHTRSGSALPMTMVLGEFPIGEFRVFEQTNGS
jgi:hypothetical protein